MSIRRTVLDVMEENKGRDMTVDQVKRQVDDLTQPTEPEITREQVNNALAGLAAWSHITRVHRGIYCLEAEPMSKLEKLLEQPTPFAGSVSGPIAEDEVAQDKFFTQVGTAKNGDLLITRDSDGAAYRATPL